jgi:dUTP pyrophosphatase
VTLHDELLAAQAELEDVQRKLSDKRLGETKLLELQSRATELREFIAEGTQLGEQQAGPLLEALLACQTLRVKPLRLTKTPVTAYTGDAGFDLEFAPADGMTRVIRPGAVEMMQTGVAVAIPEGYAGLVLPRSGLASSRGLTPVNAPGLIDSGYRGEIIVALTTHFDARQMVAPGERIAQLVIVPVLTPAVEIVDELDVTERGDQGFGSSGA